MAIKPSGTNPTVTTSESTPTQKTTPVATPEVTAQMINPESVDKALKDYNKLRKNLKQPFMSGAAGLFTDNIVFPSELLDTNNPANDAKYLHLASAVFGMKGLAKKLGSKDQRDEDWDDEEDLDEDELKEELDRIVKKVSKLKI